MPDEDEVQIRARILEACWGSTREIEPVIRAQIEALVTSLFAISASADDAAANIRRACDDMLSDVEVRYHACREEACACHAAHQATRQ